MTREPRAILVAAVPRVLLFFAALASLTAVVRPAIARPPASTAEAALARRVLDHYKEGSRLFANGLEDAAFVEFKLSWDLSGGTYPNALFMMAQTQYHRGLFKEARALYQQFLDDPDHEADLTAHAQGRIAAIENRKSVLSINAVPDGVDVKLVNDAGVVVASGQAPNRFEVPAGHYRLTVSKPNHVPQTRSLDVEFAAALPLFFHLSPVPARLQIRTKPRNATLFVRGSRARNPFEQVVEPGEYEIYAEATDFESRRDIISVRAGELRDVDFQLRYVQRSGRPELIGFWTAVGAAAGASGVLARLSQPEGSFSSYTASATVVAAGAMVGGVTGGLIARAYAPPYIRDNLALFRIGALWTGAAEGALVGLTIDESLRAAWLGGALGLGGGAVVGSWLDERAPNYGRVMLIQSAAAFGVVAGLMAVPAFAADLGLSPTKARAPGLLVGLNLGLGTGLAAAYLPDQRVYGPTWRRVVLVDLAGVAGAFAGALVSTLGDCLDQPKTEQGDFRCEFRSTSRTAKLSLAGTAVGLLAGWVLTRSYDDDTTTASNRTARLLLPLPTAVAVTTATGRTGLVPGIAAQGRF